MNLIKKIFYLIKEKGIIWALNRWLYSIKLKVLSVFPCFEILFEKKISRIKRIDAFEPKIDLIKELLNNLPDKKKDTIISEANAASNGTIHGFSSISLNYGMPIDWQLNPLTQARTDKNLKWYRISDFNEKIGDIKIICKRTFNIDIMR